MEKRLVPVGERGLAVKMGKSSDQKLKLLYIVKILEEESDERHCISTRELIAKLGKYGISAERKSIYNDMEQLTRFGYDIVYVKARQGGGYYLAGRQFELPELKLLVDAVQSFRFITPKKSRELIRKIGQLAGKHGAKQLQRQVYVAGRIKTENESIYYNVDSIHRAIQEDCQIIFQYMEWTADKEWKPRRGGEKYRVSPWALTCKDENYYLVGYDRAADRIKHYRVDKMGKIELDESSPRDGGERFGKFDIGEYANKTFGMFGGKETVVSLELPERMAGIALDRFGRDIEIRRKAGEGEARLLARMEVAVSGQFFGWLAGLGAEAVIVSPEEVARKYRDYLKAILDRYEAHGKEGAARKMEIGFADRMKEFGEGIFQTLNEKKKELESRGKEVYNLSVGTPDFKPAQHIMDAVAEAAGKPENYKYALEDLPELTEAVMQRFRQRYGVELEADEIMSVYGSQEGITHIGFTLCNAGDVVLAPNPGYPIFSIGPSLAGAKLATYELLPEHGYLPDLEGIGEEVRKAAKFMIVSYPLNPICKAAPKSFYERLVPWAAENGILLVHDNAYSDIIYDGREGLSILSIPGAKEVCVEFYSLSKSFNYTGARMGFLVGNREIVAKFKKLRSQIDYGTFLPVQYGAIAALTGPDDMVREQCAEYQKRRDALCGGFRRIGWEIPDSEGTMFAWGRIPEKFGDDDVAFVMELMEKSGVLCTPGSSFGALGKGYVRFALTMPVEKIKEAVAAVERSGAVR